jgi:Uma2 family endonuclease
MVMAASANPPIRLLKVDEVLRMVDAGILGKDEPVELLDGLLVEMTPQGPLHANTIDRLAERLRAAYRTQARVREDKPLFANKYSLPEPDIAVVRGQPETFATRHPDGTDAILVVEVAWSSLEIDRRKAAIYAAAGIPVYWILDLAARKLQVRTSPQNGSYKSVQILGEADAVALPELAVEWTVRDLLP